MTDSRIDPSGDQLVSISRLQRHRPIGPQIDVRSVEEPKTDQHEADAENERRWIELIIGKVKQSCRHPENGGDRCSEKRR